MAQSEMRRLPVASCAACWDDFSSEAELESHISSCHPGLSSSPFLVASRPKNVQVSRTTLEPKSRLKPKLAVNTA
jgi:hypothetical protein